ncbi:MAG TPA: hypothetical protein VH593_25205 [Ktedonobacteraceae bacterium]|jgi:hypothetical protein
MEPGMEVAVRILVMVAIIWNIQGCPTDDYGHPIIYLIWKE